MQNPEHDIIELGVASVETRGQDSPQNEGESRQQTGLLVE